MGAAQSGLLGNSQAQNGRVDLARLRSALREQSQQDPTKQQLYALLLEEYTSTDDEKDDAVSHDIPLAPALVTREGTPTSKTDTQSHGGDNDVTRKLSPDCSRDGDSASKASDSDSGQKTPSDVGDATKISSGGSLDDKPVVKPTPMATDSLPESRKRSHCTDIVAPKKKFLHGFRNRSNSMNVDQSDGEAKVVPASVTSSSSSSSTPTPTPTPQVNGNLESRSNSGSGTPETPGGQSNGGSVSMPTAMPNNLRIRNIIETLMNTDMIRRHLEYDGPEHEIQSLASTDVAKSIDTKGAGSEEGSPRPLEPQTIQNQMQKALLLDTHPHSPSGDVAKPLALREHAGPLQLIKEQVISISPGIECQTSTSGASYRVMSSVGQAGEHRSGEHGAVMSSVPAEIKQNRAQLAYSVQCSQMVPTHPQFVGHARQYQPAGIATGRSLSRSSPAPKPVTGGGADPYSVLSPGGASWVSRKSVLAGIGDPARQPYERFHPGEDRVVDQRDAWLDGRQQEASQGCVNICPQIVDKNMTMTAHQTLPPGSVYRTHTGGSLTHGCPDVAAANSLMLHQEAVGVRNEAGVVYDRRLISPRSRYEGARHSHEMLNHPGAVQQLGSHMPGGGSSPMSRVPPHAPELQRSPPGMYHPTGCSGHVGCHECSSVTSVRQPVVTSRPHSRYDMTRWELTHQHELPSRMPQQRASPVRAAHHESPGGVNHHRSPIPGIELSQPSEIVQPVSGRGPPPLIPLTASQASYVPPEFRQRCLSQSEGHHRNGSGAKPWQERKPEKESPLDLSGRKEQYVVPPRSEGTGADVNIPLDLSVRNAPVVAPPPPGTVDDGHYTKREVGQSFVHPQQITPAGDVGTTQRGNSNPALGFPNMSQHIMKLQQSINRTIQDIDEPAARSDPPSHPNQLHRQNASPENTLMKQYPNMAGVTHHPPLWHMPLGGVPREYPTDTQRHNSREVKMLVPPPTFPPGKTATQKTSFRYGTVSILGNHPPNDILFLRCNLCGLTYGSQHSIKKHFNKVHGRDPTPDAVTVQTISDMRNAISQAGEKLAKEHQDKVDKMTTSPGSKNEMAPEQNHRSNDGHCKKPEQNTEPKPEEKRPAEGERQKKREQDAKNCQALSPQRKSSHRVARAPLVKCDGDSDNHSDSNVDVEKSMMKCLQCGQDFPTRDWGVFRRHVRTHDLTPDAIYKCSVCSVGFRDAAKRRTHMSTAHSITSCMCRKCNIGFTHIGALNKHLKTAHMDGQRVDVEYRCLYCPKYFAVQDDLMLHTQRHETPDDNTDTAVAAKPAKDKTVPVVMPPSRHATPDTSNDKFPYPDLTIVEEPIVIANNSPTPPAVRRNTVSLPWKPTMSHHVPTGKTLQEMLMEKIEPQASDRKEAKLVNGTNIPPALVCAQTATASQGDDVKMTSSMASHDQNMKRRLDTQVPATEQLTKKVKPEDTPLPKLTTSVDEQAIQTAQRLLKDIVKTANSGTTTATTTAESLRDKESKVSNIMQGVLRSFPVLRHKPENIREVIETLVTAELTGELPQRFATDTMEDATNDSENTSNNQQVAARQGNEMDEVRSGSVPTVSPKDSNETLPKTSLKTTEKTAAAEEPERDTTLWEKSQDSSVHTKISVPSEKDSRDIPAKDSVSAICAPTRFPEKTASEKALENKSYLGMTVLEAYVPKKAGDYRKSGKSYAKPAKCTEASSDRHAAPSSATPSTSGSFNPLRALQFTEFHPTLCTDHACEGNYLEKLHGHCHGHGHDHGHCHNHDEEDVSKKGKLDDTESGPDKTSLRPCDRPVDKTSVPLCCTDGPCDTSHGCKSALVGTSSGDASSTVVSDVD